MGYEILRYQPEFKQGVVKLLERLWSFDPAVNAACLEWKYERNPYQTEPLLYLALEQGRVVGMRGMCGARWEAGIPQIEVDIPCAADLVIAADHSNRGLISQIMRFAFEDLKKRGTEYVFNLSAGPVTFLNSLAMGWQSIGPLQAAARKHTEETYATILKEFISRWPSVLHLARTFKKRAFVRDSAPSSPFMLLERNFGAKAKARNPQIFLESRPRPRRMADLVQRIGSDGRIRHVRDRQYFAWRFQEPLSTYRFLYWGQSSLEGYLVLETRVASSLSGSSTVRVADWEATNNLVLGELMKAAIQMGQFDDLVAWKMAVPRPAQKLLADTGFQSLSETYNDAQYRYRPTVLVRPTVTGKNRADWRLGKIPLLDASSWDIRIAYSV